MRISKNLELMNYIKSSENNGSDYIRFRQEIWRSFWQSNVAYLNRNMLWASVMAQK